MNHATAAIEPLQAVTPVTQMRAGTKPADALTHVSCLLRGLRSVGQGGVVGDGLDADQCFLLVSNLDAVIAIVDGLQPKMGRAA